MDLLSTGHLFAMLFGFAGQDQVDLGGGMCLLADILHPDGELLGMPVMSGYTAHFNLPVPNSIDLQGYAVSTQAVHFGGGLASVLSNAQDLILGF